MAYQHQEFWSRLQDAERLRLYSQSTVSDQKARNASLIEAKASSRRWESEAQEVIERAVQAEARRDAAWHEASMAKLNAEATGSARAQVESELARVQHALAALEEAR